MLCWLFHYFIIWYDINILSYLFMEQIIEHTYLIIYTVDV